jgi:hypothetical protein
VKAKKKKIGAANLKHTVSATEVHCLHTIWSVVVVVVITTGVKLNKHWYDHVPWSVETSHEGKVTILWNQQAWTDRIIRDNKPDSIIHDKKGTRRLMNVAIPRERNVIKKEAEKILI